MWPESVGALFASSLDSWSTNAPVFRLATKSMRSDFILFARLLHSVTAYGAHAFGAPEVQTNSVPSWYTHVLRTMIFKAKSHKSANMPLGRMLLSCWRTRLWDWCQYSLQMGVYFGMTWQTWWQRGCNNSLTWCDNQRSYVCMALGAVQSACNMETFTLVKTTSRGFKLMPS